MSCSSCKERQKELEVAAKEVADQNPFISRYGKDALKEKGLSKSKLTFIFIKAMSHILKIDAYRPATRNIDVAHYFIGEKLINDNEYREMFNKTTVTVDKSSRKTIINIGGKLFDSDTKFKSRAKKCNIVRKLVELKTNSNASSPEEMDPGINDKFDISIDPLHMMFDEFE